MEHPSVVTRAENGQAQVRALNAATSGAMRGGIVAKPFGKGKSKREDCLVVRKTAHPSTVAPAQARVNFALVTNAKLAPDLRRGDG